MVVVDDLIFEDEGIVYFDGFWNYEFWSQQCLNCRHKSRTFTPVCQAYPKRAHPIPLAIWTGEHDHTQPYEGDQGIRFEPIEPEPER